MGGEIENRGERKEEEKSTQKKLPQCREGEESILKTLLRGRQRRDSKEEKKRRKIRENGRNLQPPYAFPSSKKEGIPKVRKGGEVEPGTLTEHPPDIAFRQRTSNKETAMFNVQRGS